MPLATNRPSLQSSVNAAVMSIIRLVCCSQLPGIDGQDAPRFVSGFSEWRMKLFEGKPINDGHFDSLPGVGKLIAVRIVFPLHRSAAPVGPSPFHPNVVFSCSFVFSMQTAS